jgi:hypothetical protein
MLRKSEPAPSICPVCGELGRVYAFGEKVVNTGAYGVDWVLSQGVCKECLKVVVEAAQEGSLPSPDGGLDGL